MPIGNTLHLWDVPELHISSHKISLKPEIISKNLFSIFEATIVIAEDDVMYARYIADETWIEVFKFYGEDIQQITHDKKRIVCFLTSQVAALWLKTKRVKMN